MRRAHWAWGAGRRTLGSVLVSLAARMLGSVAMGPFHGRLATHAFPRNILAMMRQALSTLKVTTRGRGFREITRDVQGCVAEAGVQTGLCTLHLQHTSASLLIQENADPDVRHDLEQFFARLVPDGDALFVHTAEGDDDMPAHVRTALTTVNLSVPVAGGRLCLGTWQGIYVWEHRRAPHTRLVVVHVIGDEQ
jgi:secondary thiamine-phosphate synthase enzyme